MIYINLSFFDTILGPQTLCTIPSSPEEDVSEHIKSLLNISEFIDLKFFVYVSSERLKTANIYVTLPSEWARGRLEMVLVSIILVDEEFNRLYVFEQVLEKIVAALNKVKQAYMGFYARYRDKSNIKKIDAKKDEIVQALEGFLPEIQSVLEEAKKIPLDSEVIETTENIQDEFAILQKDDTAFEAARKLAANPRVLLGCVLDEENVPIGVLDEDDILNETMLKGRDPLLVSVEEIMTRDILKIDANDPIENAINLMTENEIEAVPIVQNGKFIGVFTIFDAANHHKNILELIGDKLKEDYKSKLEESKNLQVQMWSYIENIAKNRQLIEKMKTSQKKHK